MVTRGVSVKMLASERRPRAMKGESVVGDAQHAVNNGDGYEQLERGVQCADLEDD